MVFKKKIKINNLKRNMRNELKKNDIIVPKKDINIEKTYKNIKCKNIVTQDEFKEYLTKGNKLLNEFGIVRHKIEVNNAIKIMGDRFNNYVSQESNKQFKKVGNIDVDVVIKNRLNEMLHYFIGNMTAEMVLIMIKYNKTDEEILKFIKNYYVYNGKIDSSIYKISKISDKIAKYTSHVTKPKIIDIGVGNGKKVKQIKSLIDCDIYGADIESWGYTTSSIKVDISL